MALFPLSGLGVSPELLFQRNYHENTALELAALSNKAEVVRYLGLLHSALGTGSRDVNDTNSAGHSVLHLLARKGDHAGGTITSAFFKKKDMIPKIIAKCTLRNINSGCS